jgi:hypothetical protein
MLEQGKYTVINIRRYLNSDNPKLGENRLLQVLSGFSCPKNPDVEHFLKNSSIEFTKKNQSVTYLVFLSSTMELVGYFALALKPLTVRGETVSNTVKRKLLRVSELDEESQTCTCTEFPLLISAKVRESNYTGFGVSQMPNKIFWKKE